MSKALAELYRLWEKLGDVPTSEGNGEVEADTIEEPFLHFPVGTHREEIWRWFEAQNVGFIVGEVMYGKRRECAES